MRNSLYDADAGKQTVSLSLNADLYARAKSLGINASKVAEKALAQEYAAQRAELLTAELRQDLAAAETYAEQHGSFAEFVRDHYDGAI